ncbi:hypothetical protein BGZ60DRAFT_378995 [Tricladium varicosporioides]|nr:hypothetical protein BGZ60DRAFT_378995 [Hymenoscyphus varicosporioides]
MRAQSEKHTDDPIVLLPEIFHSFATKLDSDANDDIYALYAELGDAKGSTNKWEDALVWLNQLSVQKKINCPHVIRLSVVYSGISPLLGAEWLLEVERRLGKLKERLETPMIASVNLWPQRLIRSDFDYGHDQVYEGSFIVGLRAWKKKNGPPGKPVDMSRVRDITTRWIEQTSKATTHDFLLLPHYDSLPDLKPCTRTWPRRVLRGDIDDDDEDEDQKIQSLPGSTPIQRAESSHGLRPAKDVLNRLKYDDKFNLDEFVIGYKDRVKNKIVEKNAIDWEKNSTTEEWIPEHRIEYFKRISVNGDEVIVWQKKTKLDLIFGSGGG